MNEKGSEGESWDLHDPLTHKVLEPCSETYLQYALREMERRLGSLDEEERKVFEEPALLRLAFYAWGFVEDWGTRCQMLLVALDKKGNLTFLAASDEERKSILAQDLEFIERFCRGPWPSGLEHILTELRDQTRRTMWTDLRKVAGAEGSIRELRANIIRGERGKIIFDLSPLWPRVEICGRKIFQYWPRGTPLEEVRNFIYEHGEELAKMLQDFTPQSLVGQNVLKGKMFFHMVDESGNPLNLGEKQPNPFPFSFWPKHEPLAKKVARKGEERDRYNGIYYEQKVYLGLVKRILLQHTLKWNRKSKLLPYLREEVKDDIQSLLDGYPEGMQKKFDKDPTTHRMFKNLRCQACGFESDEPTDAKLPLSCPDCGIPFREKDIKYVSTDALDHFKISFDEVKDEDEEMPLIDKTWPIDSERDEKLSHTEILEWREEKRRNDLFRKSLDPLDQKILSFCEKDPNIKSSEIARKLDKPEKTIRWRRKRLRERWNPFRS